VICTVCGSEAPAGAWRCWCGGPLDLPDAPAVGIGDGVASSEPGLWRYAQWIPVEGAGLSMGEGWTPLIPAGGDLPDVHLKLEFVSPTLSFKDRGAVVLVASAVECGASSVIADSSGNAGSAIAAYAARAGLECRVFIPSGTSAGKQAQIRAYGAALELVDGDRSAVTEAAIAAVRESGAFYASHIYDPTFLQGTKTFAFELWEQLGRVPEAVVLPVGNGTLLLGAVRGFRELLLAGLIERVPAMIALQSERCAPLARAFDAGAVDSVAIRFEQTLAEGIAIPRPPRAAQILAAVRETGGCIVAVPESALDPAQRDLAGRGLLVEPTAALTWAGAMMALRGSGGGGAWARAFELARAERVVVPLCGAGLKSSHLPR
jgi:threonine synthase